MLPYSFKTLTLTNVHDNMTEVLCTFLKML